MFFLKTTAELNILVFVHLIFNNRLEEDISLVIWFVYVVLMKEPSIIAVI